MIATTYDKVKAKGLFIAVSDVHTEAVLMRRNEDGTASPYGRGWRIEGGNVESQADLTGLPVRNSQSVIKIKLGVGI